MSNVKIQGSPTGTGNVTLVAPVTNSEITITLPSADGTLASAGSIGDGTLTMNTSGVGLSGSQTFTANQTGNATFTIASNATSVNTVSTVVARDASGNFSAGTITAALSGNSTTSTTATNLAGGSAGTVPYQSAAGTTVQLAAGTAGQVLQSNGAAAPSWATIASANNGTLTMNVSGTGLSGSQTFTANQSSNATFTVTSNATNANTASTIVARDGSGNFSAGTITATLSGNASTASNASLLNSLSSTQLFNNMGQNHNTYTDANAFTNFGTQYLQGATNGPGNGNSQWYMLGMGLGNEYAYSQYAMQFAIPRTPTGGNPYLALRFREAGSWQSWSKIWAGYADSAGTATNLSGGSVTLSGGFVMDTPGSGYARFSNWVNLNGFYGLYSGNNGAHFYPNNLSYGSWRMDGTRNGWYGIEFGNQTTLMMNDDSYGFHRNIGGAWRFYVSGGSGYFPGNITAYWSDERLKENLREIKREALDILGTFTAYRFNWNSKVAEVVDTIPVGKEEIGLIAQQVQKRLPDAVVVNKAGAKVGQEDFDYLTINYDRITPLLVEGVNIHDAEIAQLKERVAQLEALVNKLLGT